MADNNNIRFLNAVDKGSREAILDAIALRYAITRDEALAELAGDDAYDVCEYLVEPQRSATSALMQRHGFRQGAAAQNAAAEQGDIAMEGSTGLPEQCYAVDLMTSRVVVLKRGEKGYYQVNQSELQVDANATAADKVDQLNAKLGVTPAQAAAMKMGSMMGFHVPGADPARYDEQGKPKRPVVG